MFHAVAAVAKPTSGGAMVTISKAVAKREVMRSLSRRGKHLSGSSQTREPAIYQRLDLLCVEPRCLSHRVAQLKVSGDGLSEMEKQLIH